MENSKINSKKIHTQTRHVISHSCKISSDLEARKYMNKNQEDAHHWCDTNCHTLIQKFISIKPQMGNPQTLYGNEDQCV